PEGGSISIKVGRQHQDPQFLLFAVSDSGCGISPETAERIFERLYQITDHTESSRKGLGLGLFICKKLVTQQGGQIWVERQRHKGATLSFTLPVSSQDLLTNMIAISEATV